MVVSALTILSLPLTTRGGLLAVYTASGSSGDRLLSAVPQLVSSLPRYSATLNHIMFFESVKILVSIGQYIHPCFGFIGQKFSKIQDGRGDWGNLPPVRYLIKVNEINLVSIHLSWVELTRGQMSKLSLPWF